MEPFAMAISHQYLKMDGNGWQCMSTSLAKVLQHKEVTSAYGQRRAPKMHTGGNRWADMLLHI